MPFGQLVIGPPGSGKSTYCAGVHQFLNAVGRKTIIVNLDPANENMPYGSEECAINIQDLISLEKVMEQLKLGPNGALVYVMEYLAQDHVAQWLRMQLEKYTVHNNYYVLFDCPGQIELYTHYNSVKKLAETMTDQWNFRLCAVNLVDAYYCTNPSNFISVLLVSLSVMINLELPHINVLSKIDLIERYGTLAFDIDYYTDVQDLSYLLDNLRNLQRNQRLVNYNFYKSVTDEVEQELEKEQKEKRTTSDTLDEDEGYNEEEEEDSSSYGYRMDDKFAKLNEALIDVIQDFSLVSFVTLNIEDKESVHGVLKWVDKANGYVFGSCERDNTSILEVAVSQTEWQYERNDRVRTKYMKSEPIEGEDDSL
jgi:GTPase SAR1 family protein